MRQLFLDTNYLAALVNDRDPLHQHSVSLAAEFKLDTSVRYVTTLAVLGELLALLSRDPYLRRLAADYVVRARASEDVLVVANDEELFDAAFALYQGRPDKTYSLVDCMSMVICRRMKITQVLTGDRDFVQEGFEILL